MSDFSTSAVVVLLPSDPASLVVSGGDHAADLHCTLWFIPDAAEAVNKAALASAVERASTIFSQPDGRVSMASLLGNDEPRASVLHLISRSIPQVRDVVKTLAPEIPPSIYDRFRPHVTLGYGLPVQTGRTGQLITFDRIALWWEGSQRIEHRFRGGS